MIAWVNQRKERGRRCYKDIKHPESRRFSTLMTEEPTEEPFHILFNIIRYQMEKSVVMAVIQENHNGTTHDSNFLGHIGFNKVAKDD